MNVSNVLMAVMTCAKFQSRADAQRATWVPFVKGADVVFFVGTEQSPGAVTLDVPDDYWHLPHKVQAMCTWALARGYKHLFKIDDDVYVHPGRLLRSDYQHDYVGPERGPSGGFPAPYSSGFAYWLSRRSMQLVADAEIDDPAEDRWVGNVLRRAGIACTADRRYTIINSLNTQNVTTGSDGPLISNDIIAVAELEPDQMRRVHTRAGSRP